MDYLHKLYEAIAGWDKDPIEDEWLFESFRQDVIGRMSPDEAFSNIDSTIEVLLEQDDESIAIEVLESIISLARQSQTTEIPSNLLKSKDSITNKFKAYSDYAKDKVIELLCWYRLH